MNLLTLFPLLILMVACPIRDSDGTIIFDKDGRHAVDLSVGSKMTFLPTYSILSEHKPFSCLVFEEIPESETDRADNNLGSISLYSYEYDGYLTMMSMEDFTSNGTFRCKIVWNDGLITSVETSYYTISDISYSDIPNPFLSEDKVAKTMVPELTRWWQGYAGQRPRLLPSGYIVSESEPDGTENRYSVKFDYSRDSYGVLDSVTVFRNGELVSVLRINN